MSEGVTTIEVKSGYGLDLETERRMLEAARGLGRELPVSIKTTFLGLHALPPDFAATAPASSPRSAARGSIRSPPRDWSDAVDAFCENIAFTLEETETFPPGRPENGDCAHTCMPDS